MHSLCAAFSRYAPLTFVACALALASPTRARAQPEPASPTVYWAVGYPRVEGGKLLFRGSVTIPAGSRNLTGSVSIYLFASNGGRAFFPLCPLDRYHTFSGSIRLNDFPNPACDYDIYPALHTISGDGQAAVSVTAPRVRLSLP